MRINRDILKMMHQSEHQIRLEKILDRLETRSGQCPGMFPVKTQQHWQQLALLHEPAAEESTPLLWQTLESFDRDPQLAHLALNRLMARHAPAQLMSVETNPKTNARKQQAAIDSLLCPPHSHYKRKHG
ncbi:MAG: hypothetical protein AAF649_11305 [Verrucomicrobiota bacterium]